MAEALLLYSGDFVCSYKDRGDIFKKVLKKKFSELSRIIPDLDKKVLLYTKFKLKPQPKDLNLDFQDIWFQARDDSIKFISYYLNKIYKLDKSLPLENPKDLSREIKNLLQRRLLLKYLKFYLSARGIKINNKVIIKLINIIAQNRINFLFAKEVFKNNGKIKFRALFSFTDPGVKFYSSLIFCLCAINKNKKVDLSLVHEGYKSINRFFPMQKFKYNNPFSNWKNLCEGYTLAFRAYQFLKI